MEALKNAVRNALALYAETSGMSFEEACARFADSEECRQNIYLLTAMQAKGGKYDNAAA